MLETTGLPGVLAQARREPSAFLAMNAHTGISCGPDLKDSCAYRPPGDGTSCNSVTPSPGGESGQLLQSFLTFAAARRRRVVGVQLTHADAELYAQIGFRVNQLGANYARAR